MPQMAPLSWLLLFLFFSFTLMLFSLFNYFFYSPDTLMKYSSQSIFSKSFNWKW